MATATSVLWDDVFLRNINFSVGTGLRAADVLLVEHLLAPPLPCTDETTRMEETEACGSPELPRTYQDTYNDGMDNSGLGGRRSSVFGHRRRPDFEMSPILNEHQSELAQFSVYDGGDESLALDSFDVAGRSPGVDVAVAANAATAVDDDDAAADNDDEWFQNDADVDTFTGRNGNKEVDTDTITGVMRRLSIDNRRPNRPPASIAPKTMISRAVGRTATIAKGKAHNRGKKVQTTMTFFYDSDEEVDDDELDDEGKRHPSAAASGQLLQPAPPPPLPAVRTALGLQKKSAKDFLDRRGAADAGSAETPEADRALTAWLAARHSAGMPTVAIAMSPLTRSMSLATVVNHALSAVDDAATAATSSSSRHLIPSAALLIVTLKAHVEEWAGHVRNLPWPRLLVYTDALPKRRKLGAYNLAQYDVVVTTFDVLRAKEAALPELASSDSDLGSVASYCSDDGDEQGEEELFERARGDRPARTGNAKKTAPASKTGQWLVRRDKHGGMVEVSNLHLIQWRQLVLDLGDDTKLRAGSVRGDAARSLHAHRRVSTAVVPAGDKPAFNRFADASRGLLLVDSDIRDKDMAYEAGGGRR